MVWRVKVEPTPNPNARKFVVGQRITDQALSFASPEGARDHPLASRLFQIPGVVRLLILNDFVTVNKSPEASWADITSKVRKALARGEESANR